MASFDKLYLAVPREYFANDPLAFQVFIDAVTKVVKRYHRARFPAPLKGSERMQYNRESNVKAEFSQGGFSLFLNAPCMTHERNLSLYLHKESDQDYIPAGHFAICYLLGDYGISEQLLRDIRKELPPFKAWLALDRNEDEPEELA